MLTLLMKSWKIRIASVIVDKDKSIDDIAYELGCNLDLNERKEYILYKMNNSCKKYEESQYDETVEVDVDQEDAYE